MVKALVGDGSSRSFLLFLDPVHRVIDPADPLIQITEQEVIRGQQFILSRKADYPGAGDAEEAACQDEESNQDDAHDAGVEVEKWLSAARTLFSRSKEREKNLLIKFERRKRKTISSLSLGESRPANRYFEGNGQAFPIES